MLGEILMTFGHWLKRDHVRKAYLEAHAAHWKAVERCDTRRIGETRQALLRANTERLKVGA